MEVTLQRNSAVHLQLAVLLSQKTDRQSKGTIQESSSFDLYSQPLHWTIGQKESALGGR